MKLNIIKDKAGKVIATYEKPHGDGPSVTPQLDSTYTVHEIEVSENYRHSIQALYEQHSK